MKRNHPLFCLRREFWALLLVVLSLCAAPCALARTYSAGILLRTSGHFDAQIKAIWKEFLPILSKRLNIPISLHFFTKDKDFEKALAQGHLDMVFAFSWDSMPVIEKRGYQPFLGLSIQGSRNAVGCLYVPSNSTATTLADLKGKRVTAYDQMTVYFQLRELVRTRPEVFFGFLKPNQSGQGSLYALALGQTDAAFVYSYNIPFLQRTNPGPLKKVKRFACHNAGIVFPPIYKHKNLPPDIAKKIAAEIVQVHSNPAYARFHPLLRMGGFKFVATQPADYTRLHNLLKNARAQGWEKDFNQWLKNVGGT